VKDGHQAQFPGWPMTINLRGNDGCKVHATLPAISLSGISKPVLPFIHEDSGEILYTVRVDDGFQPPVYAPGIYTIKASTDHPTKTIYADYQIN
jgi:hypothetical protein